MTGPVLLQVASWVVHSRLGYFKSIAEWPNKATSSTLSEMLVVRLELHKSSWSCIATWVLTFNSRQLLASTSQEKTYNPHCDLGKDVWRLQSG